MKRHIFAIVGGGFRMRKIHRSISAKRSGEYLLYPDSEPSYIEKFYKAFPHEHTSHITIEQMQQQGMIKFLLQRKVRRIWLLIIFTRNVLPALQRSKAKKQG